MKNRRLLYYIMLIAGAAIIIYAQDDAKDNWMILIFGIALLMGGLFGINKGITGAKPDMNSFIRSEEEEE